MGLTVSTADALFAHGVDVITSGNHIWDKKEIYPALEANDRILRPLNYGTEGVPGRGWGTYHALDGTELAVINLQGRTYMQPIENPFLVAESLLEEAGERCTRSAGRLPLREITSEKNAMASTSTDGSRRWSARTPTSRPPMIGSCRRGRRTRATSARGRRVVDHRVQPGYRAAAVPDGTPDEVRGCGRAGRLQRNPDRRRSGDRSGAGDRTHPAGLGGVTR